MDVFDSREALLEQLATVPGARVYSDPGANVSPPGILVSVPTLQWDAAFVEPTIASFQVIYAVNFDDRAATNLMKSGALISDAIDDPTFTIDSASPGTWESGGVSMPSYNFVVSAALSY